MKVGAVVAILLAASPCFAYVRSTNIAGKPIFWRSNLVFVQGPAVFPPGLSQTDTVHGLSVAAEAWGAPDCTSLTIAASQHLGATPEVMNDGKPQVIVRTDKWCDGMTCHDPLLLALTSVFARATDGEIVDADIELNAVNFQWTNIPDSGVNPRQGAADLANVLTHELGHLLGLSDNCAAAGAPTPPLDDTGKPAPPCDTAPAALREGTMFPGTVPDDIGKRTLAPDDVAAVCALFPLYSPPDAGAAGDALITIGASDAGPSPPPMPAGKSSGCQVGGGASGGPWAALAVALLALRRRRRRHPRIC
jgi:MYXO-CTERM domain-containing protein